MLEKVEGGWKIRSHVSGKLYPKVYTSKEAAQARINQMERFKHTKKGKFIIIEKARILDEVRPPIK